MKIEIQSNAQFRKALRNFAPDLEKTLKAEMRAGLKPVVRQAKGFVPSTSPLSGWANRSFNEGTFPTFSPSTIKSKIGYSVSPSKPNKNGFTSMATVFNNSRAGAIYEGAGRNGLQGQPWVGPKGPAGHRYSHSRNPKAGEQFIGALPELTGSLKGRGRLIYKAWAENKGVAEGAVMKAISKAEINLVQRSKESPLRRVA